MKVYLDCIPCFFRQALDSARFVTDDESVHERVLIEVMKLAENFQEVDNSPAMAQKIHRIIRQVTENPDPYKQQKRNSNELALKLLDELEEKVHSADDSIDAAIRLAIAGNIIDFGVHSSLEDDYIEKIITESLTAEFDDGHVEKFKKAVEKAEDVLYLGDNAGEIVFDRVLIEHLPYEKITFAVKGSPVINDATMEDAEEVGLTEMVEVIDNGSDGPGTMLETCSGEFLERFEDADLIVSKGQGNYESLSEVDKNIYFILKAKCPVISRDLGCKIGKMILFNKAVKEREETNA